MLDERSIAESGHIAGQPSEPGLVRPHFPMSLEKWYIDVLLEDGTVCLVYIGQLSVLGRRIGRVTAELFRPDAITIRGAAPSGRLEGAVGSVRCSAASIQGEHLRFETDALSGELRYRPRYGPWEPARPFLASGSRRLTWAVEIPDADVEGELRWPGGDMQVRGRGYRDRVWFDVLPWRFPIRRLSWGRAVAGSHAAVWTCAEKGSERVGYAWRDGEACDPGGSSSVPDGVVLGSARVFLDSDVASLEGLRLGVFRRPLAWLSGAPHETKSVGFCEIEGERGVGVWEDVRWR